MFTRKFATGVLGMLVLVSFVGALIGLAGFAWFGNLYLEQFQLSQAINFNGINLLYMTIYFYVMCFFCGGILIVIDMNRSKIRSMIEENTP